MRCPKCHYISFGSVDRCRNCGYELSLAPEAKPIDLPIQDAEETGGPLGDFPLSQPTPIAQRPASPAHSEGVAAAATAAKRAPSASRFDLPLFGDRTASNDDAPLVSAPAVPRQPLSVRRAQPPIAKARPDDAVREPRYIATETQTDGASQEQAAADAINTAPIFRRLIAGIVDVLTLASLDAGILYFTLRVLELTFADVLLLPPVPLGVFLILLNGGYLAAFTAAGGQTIGKMLMGIRVVPDPAMSSAAYGRVTFGSAVLRAAAYLVSLAPAGLGFAPILFATGGRALHDRLANTRVVRA
jgi:uncharacterized RDD family membrane protein YckC